MKVKGSRFIASLSPAANTKTAEKIITDIRKEYDNAAHHCFAFRTAQSTFRFSDDGEPSGTAGRPILSMIDKYKLQKVVLVVTRYFGGTKLGTGGLLRAYSRSAEQVIREAKIIRKKNYFETKFSYPFNTSHIVKQLVYKFDGRIRETATDGGMFACVEVAPSQIDTFKKSLLNSSSGKVKFISPDEC